MNNEIKNTVILDLTKHGYIPTVPCAHDSPSIKVFEFWTERGERINNLRNINQDTKKILIKTENGLQTLILPEHMQRNLLDYFKYKNRKEFKDFTCHELVYHIMHGSLDNICKYTIKKTNLFEVGDTILLGTFTHLLWKTICLDVQHSAICLIDSNEGLLFLSKLGSKEKVIVTTLSELKEIYWSTSSCAKTIWKR